MRYQIKKAILKNIFLRKIIIFIKDIQTYVKYRKNLVDGVKKGKPIIYYLGIPAHANLGDLAQGVCIRNWIRENFQSHYITEIETNALVNTKFSVLPMLRKFIKDDDLIVFQSGYTTTDLGGHADEMHRAVIEAVPDQKMIMMPQTIFFKSDINRIRTSKSYNSAPNLLFLARDKISYEVALDMFPDIKTELFPDIVTTLIGARNFNFDRDGVLFCCRDDEEKYYNDEAIQSLVNRFSVNYKTEMRDTTKKENHKIVVKNATKYIDEEIMHYAHFRLIVTDRYHGTILSLIAGTPVIVIRTTDHKVTTGAEWFKGVYDNHIFLVDTLEDAYLKGIELLNTKLDYSLSPYYKERFYDKLSNLWID